MLTVHTLGGPRMLKEAVRSSKEAAAQFEIEKPKILGVTVLTSMDNKALKKIGIDKDAKAMVLSLAKEAVECGLDGVVASAKETKVLRKALGKKFLIVTPGIRPGNSEKGDQKRVATPAEAIKKGSDFIVVGRSIISAKDPKQEAEKILKEMKDA